MIDDATFARLQEVKARRWNGEQFISGIERIGYTRKVYRRARGVKRTTVKRWINRQQEVAAREQEWVERVMGFVEEAAFLASSPIASDMTPFRFREVISLLRWGGIRGMRYPVLEAVTGIPERDAIAMARGWCLVSAPLAAGLESITDGLQPRGDAYNLLGRLGWSPQSFAGLRGLDPQRVGAWIKKEQDLEPADREWLNRTAAFAAQARKLHGGRCRNPIMGGMTASRFGEVLTILGWDALMWEPWHTRVPFEDITGILQKEVAEMTLGLQPVPGPLGEGLEAVVAGVRPWQEADEDQDRDEDDEGEDDDSE